jgi:hypothetical protein
VLHVVQIAHLEPIQLISLSCNLQTSLNQLSSKSFRNLFLELVCTYLHT